jgi:SpoVK/Ycf46/Vps4 family AAA+-type ATPase
MEDNEQKQLIRGLVKQRLIVGSEVSDDLISGKGSGCIFLLYGPPGTGKTLTAEATAELLERPLYQITVAELGTDAEQLEAGLEKALRLASHWRAVVLMDEADNFLERRGKNDLERNAMVSVFLRLLEYYDGVLFLTTNRVNEFDPAFYSRISVPIMYPELPKNVRRKVWTNLLEAAKAKLDESITLEALAAFNLNGREIRNCIYLAQCTAQFTGRSAKLLTSSELLVPINMKLQFREAMEKQQIE